MIGAVGRELIFHLTFGDPAGLGFGQAACSKRQSERAGAHRTDQPPARDLSVSHRSALLGHDDALHRRKLCEQPVLGGERHLLLVHGELQVLGQSVEVEVL